MKIKRRSIPRWQTMQRASELKPVTDEMISRLAEHGGLSRDDAASFLLAYGANREIIYYVNDLYQVAVCRVSEKFFHLNIRRRDGLPIMRDWRHFQAIKNDIMGPEFEAVELYPAESRKVDTSNKYHLYVLADRSRFEFGWDDRAVTYDDNPKIAGMRQRTETMVFE